MTTNPPAAPPPGPGSHATPAGRRHRLSPRLVALGALTVSVLTGVVALCALGVAFDARRQAADARSQIDARSAPATVDPTQRGAGGPSATSEPAPPAQEADPVETPAPLDVLNPRAAYTPVYSDEVLNPQATRDSDALIDLDEPRVGADHNRADVVIEVGFRSDVPFLTVRADDQAVAEAGNPALTPEDCSDLIRTGPLPRDAEIPAQRGTVLCVTTSPTQAAAQGINQRMVVLRVTALGDEARVTIEVSAWEVPR